MLQDSTQKVAIITGADVVEHALNRFGRIDTLVNDAGAFIAKPLTDYTDEDDEAVAGVNLRGYFDISRSAIAAMLAHGGSGHLVNLEQARFVTGEILHVDGGQSAGH